MFFLSHNLKQNLWYFLILTSLSYACALKGENSLPQRISMPWKFLNYSAEFKARHKVAFTQSLQAWRERVIAEPSSLFLDAEKKNLRVLQNLRALANEVFVGKPIGALQTTLAVSFEPILCSLGEQTLVFMTLTDAVQENLLSSGHSILASRDIQRLNGNELTPVLTKAVIDAGTKALARVKDQEAAKNDALQIGLRSMRTLTRKDQGSTLCLNLLLSEKLSEKNFQVIAHIGLESLQSVRQIYQVASQAMRATRNVSIEWTFPANNEGTLPMNLSYKLTAADAVFGDHIKKITERRTMEFSIGQDQSLAFEMDETFLKFLEQEKSSLAYSEPPKISKIYGAWVYLDKGRAWGLQLRDRLVFGSSNGIKGHVVGFFGPELKLKSIDGNDINEGAIVFIRKGQRLVKRGLEASYDSRTFPTPWPPN